MGIEKTIELQGKIELQVSELGEKGRMEKDQFIHMLFGHLSKQASAFTSDGARVKSITFMMKETVLRPDMNFTGLAYVDVGSHLQDLTFGSYDNEKVYLQKLLDFLYSEAKAFQGPSVKVSHFSIQTV